MAHMLSQDAIQEILGIKEKTCLSPREMATMMKVSFFPYDTANISPEIQVFAEKLTKTFHELGVSVVPYADTLEKVPFRKIAKRFFNIIANNFLFAVYELFRKEHPYYFINFSALRNLLKRWRIKRGISVIALGKNKTWKLPIDYTSSFTQNSIITILDQPKDIDEKSEFQKHFDTAMDLFSYHMTQIVILVSKKEWILYNFNASHPVYSIDEDFKEHVLDALVPKIVAPIRPHKFTEFVVLDEHFDVTAKDYQSQIADIVIGAKAFDATGLYPKGKKIADMPFRNGFYRWIGKIHLDNRSGMSYGFLAKQMPVEIEKLVPIESAMKQYPEISSGKDYFWSGGKLFIVIELNGKKFCMKVPPIWVLSQKSGSDKTNVHPETDILKLGLVDGKMYLQMPRGMKLTKDYRPSFDTKVILAHAVGNAISASILEHVKPASGYAKQAKEKGFGIAHWHGYFNPEYLPKGWLFHGNLNPHVACSTAQSAIFALDGKLNIFEKAFADNMEYNGDVHIEPHHGTNINFTSITDLAHLLRNNPQISVLGNKYLYLYK